MQKWFVLLGLSFGTLAFSQSTSEFQRIDAWASGFEPNTTNLGVLVQELTSPAQNELEKVRAIYTFVVHYISYDAQAFRDGNRRLNRNSTDVLVRKKAVCWGYAELVRELCQSAGIPAWTVSGYVRQSGHTNTWDVPNHAWNVVQIENEYYILEPTWASTLRGNVKVVDPYWLADPSKFVDDHLPVLDMFQLQSCIRTWAQFRSNEYSSLEPSSCSFEFRDSLKAFAKMPISERKLFEAESVFLQNPTSKNSTAWGHALADAAVQAKERGDSLYEQEQFAEALLSFHKASSLFRRGEPFAQYYDWQLEAWGLGELNRAQVLYRQQYEEGRRAFPEVVANVHQARNILNQIKHPGFSVRQAQQFIDRYLQALE